MLPEELASCTQPQRDRLAFIELRLRFLGEIRRNDLVSRFGIQVAAATRDIALYKSLSPGNLSYNGSGKFYERGEPFTPIFSFSPERVLTWISQGFGDGEPVRSKSAVPCDVPTLFQQPDLDILSVISRAINYKKAIAVEYQDAVSGLTKREIVPFALADNGIRWQVRGYDRLEAGFENFVLTRILSAQLVDGAVLENETQENDIQWNRVVELQLVPHPLNVMHPEVIEAEYGLKAGVLNVRIRAALAGYALRHLNVDCSEKASCKGQEYHLWLRNHQALYGVENISIAPGYSESKSHR
jgi:hypothetical protein